MLRFISSEPSKDPSKEPSNALSNASSPVAAASRAHAAPLFMRKPTVPTEDPDQTDEFLLPPRPAPPVSAGPMSEERWRSTQRYLGEVFANETPALERLRAAASAEGFPEIAISPDVGNLLSFLINLSGAERILELGTLAGYSTLWMAEAIRDSDDAHIWTVERDADRAAFARAHLAAAGHHSRTTVVVGAALAELPTLLDEVGSLDLVFVDADKRENDAYWDFITPYLRPGGLFVVDNILGTSEWWIDSDSEEAKIVDSFNRRVASDPAYEVVGLSQREGLLIARKR